MSAAGPALGPQRRGSLSDKTALFGRGSNQSRDRRQRSSGKESNLAVIVLALLVAVAFGAGPAPQPDAREIVRHSIELDQVNWQRMKDYTWVARDVERRLDSGGHVKSEQVSSWETLILYGEPYRRMLVRNGKPASADEQHKLDRYSAKLEHETPDQRARRLQRFEKQREKDRDFLREIPDLYDFRLEGDAVIDGRPVWVISGTPKPGYQPRRSEARPLLKIHGRIWIDKAEYQWVRLEAETTGTISYGIFLARLDPGAKLVFEQTRVNNEVWLPRREWMRGSGRIGLLKKLAMEDEITWTNYRKFQVESKISP